MEGMGALLETEAGACTGTKNNLSIFLLIG